MRSKPLAPTWLVSSVTSPMPNRCSGRWQLRLRLTLKAYFGRPLGMFSTAMRTPSPRARSSGPAAQRASGLPGGGGWTTTRGAPDLDGQSGASNEGLLGVQPPDASVQGRMQGRDGYTVLLNEMVEVGILSGVPALVHHDLNTVVPRLGRPTVGAIQAERV